MAADDAELLRLRDRVHKLSNDVLGLRYEIDALREWRVEVRLQLEQVEYELEGMLKADEVAEAVAEKMSEQHTFHLTLVQKTAAIAVGVVAVADGIKGLFGL